MPVIHEEDESHDRMLHADFSELLDLPENAFPGSDDILASSTVAVDPLLQPCIAHPNTSEYVDHIKVIHQPY
jgi:hypothetical protein